MFVPKWLRPKEITGLKYWLHIVIIAVVILGLLELLFGGGMFTIKNVIISVPLLVVADVVAHSLLGLD